MYKSDKNPKINFCVLLQNVNMLDGQKFAINVILVLNSQFSHDVTSLSPLSYLTFRYLTLFAHLEYGNNIFLTGLLH